MNVSATYVPLRILLQDLDSTVRRYSDTVLAQAVQTCLTLQRVPDIGLTPDNAAFDPTPSANQFALVLLKTTHLFVAPQSDGYSYQTRALKESWTGRSRDWLYELNSEMHRLENGTMFLGWQDLYSWFAGNEGLPLGLTFTEVNVNAPTDSVTIP